MKEEPIESKIEKLEAELKKLKEEMGSKKEKKAEKPSAKQIPPQKKKIPRKRDKKEKILKKKLEEPILKPRKPSEVRKTWLRFERMIGERWLVWVGAIIVAAAFGVFLKYAFEQGWINEYIRLILGFIGGILLVWLGQYLFIRRFEALAQGISSLGLIILYLTTFTSYHFYHIIGIWCTFGIFLAITIGGMTIAMLRNAYSMAFLSILGGFATPLMLADPTSTAYYEPFLFTYLFIINMGVLYVSSVKRWRAISFISFLFTVIYFVSWFVSEYTQTDFSLACGFTAGYFVLFSFMSTPQSFLQKKRSRWEDVVLIILNSLVFFIIGYVLLKDRGVERYIPLIPLGMAIYHFILAGVIRKANSRDVLLYVVFMGTAIGLLTLPIPMLVKGYWITVSWGGEAVILILIGSLINRKPLRIGGLAIFGLVALRLLSVDMIVGFIQKEPQYLYMNLRFLAHLLSTLSFGIGAFLFEKMKNITSRERGFRFPLWVLLIVALFWIMNLELFSYFKGFTGLALKMVMPYTTLLWTAFFFFILIIGIQRGIKSLRIGGLFMMVFTGVKILFVDLPVLYDYYEYGYPFLLNMKFLSLAIFLFSILLCALLYSSKRRAGVEFTEDSLWLLWGSFATILFIGMTVEIFSFFNPMSQDMRLMRFLISTSYWIGFTMWFLFSGIIRKKMYLQIIGYILAGISAFKYFLIDIPLLSSHPFGLPFVLNFRFLTLAFLLAVIGVTAALYRRRGYSDVEKKGGATVPVLWTTFLSLLFLGLNIEIILFFNRFEILTLRLESFIFTSILWALFSLALILIGESRKIPAIRITGLVIVFLTFLKVVLEDSTILYPYAYGFPFLFNLKFASAAVLLFVFAYIAVFYEGKKELLGFERRIGPFLWTLFLILLFIEMHSQAAFAFYRAWDLGAQRAAFVLSLFWVIYGLGLLFAGLIRKILPLRISALSLFGITLCKVFFVDLRYTGKLYKIFVLFGVGTIFLIAAYLYRKFRQFIQERAEEEEEKDTVSDGNQRGEKERG